MGTFTPPPTLAGYTAFIRSYMQVDTTVLPDGSAFIADSFDSAMETCQLAINCVSPQLYTQAIYNLGGAFLVQIATDAPNAPVYRDNLPFWQYMRKKFGISGTFVGGTIQSTSDESTSESLNVPENFQKLTIMDLMLLKTPWGQAYLAIAEQFGTVWGLS